MFYLTGDDGVREQTLSVLDEICESPCTGVDALTITNGYADSVFGSIEVWKVLRKIRHVGYLSVQRAEGLKDLRGLESLTSVGTLELQDLPDLVSLAGLENLQRIDYSLIASNLGLQSLDGMPKITKIGREVRLSWLPHLSDISAMRGVVVGSNHDSDDSWASSTVTIRGLTALASLGGAFSTQSVLGGLSIRENDSLTDLNGLSDLRRLDGISIVRNRSLPVCVVTDFIKDLQTFQTPSTGQNGGSEGCP